MKVINILGSPRKKGTSARIAEAFTDSVAKHGAEVEHFYLNGLMYRGCQGCEICHSKKDHCILEDDLTPVLEAMRTADVTVFSSPVYYSDISGQFKTFFDRTYSLLDVNYEQETTISSRLPEGKTAIFILTQGDVEEKHTDIIERYRPFFDLHGYALKTIRAAALASGRPDEDVSVAQAEAARMAENLMSIEK